MLSTARESLRPWHLRSRLAPAGLTTLLHGGRPPLQPPSLSVLSEGLARSRLSVTPDTGFLLFPYHLPTSSLLCVFTALTFFCLESSHSSFKSCPIAASPGKSFTFFPPYPHPLNKVRSLLYNPSGLSRRCITANITVLLHSLLHMLCTPLGRRMGSHCVQPLDTVPGLCAGNVGLNKGACCALSMTHEGWLCNTR